MSPPSPPSPPAEESRSDRDDRLIDYDAEKQRIRIQEEQERNREFGISEETNAPVTTPAEESSERAGLADEVRNPPHQTESDGDPMPRLE